MLLAILLHLLSAEVFAFEPRGEALISRVYPTKRTDHYFLNTIDHADKIRTYRCQDTNRDAKVDTCLLVHPRGITLDELKSERRSNYWINIANSAANRGSNLINRCLLRTPEACHLQRYLYFTNAFDGRRELTYRDLKIDVVSEEYLEKIIYSFYENVR